MTFEPGDPQVVRVTGENVTEVFERVIAAFDYQANGVTGATEPGWRCRTCGWMYPGIGAPPPHRCTTVPAIKSRRVGAIAFSLQILVDMLRTHTPITFFVREGLPEDAQALGANYDAATQTIQLFVTSDSFGEVSIDERGNAQLAVQLPQISMTFVAVTPVVEMKEEYSQADASLEAQYGTEEEGLAYADPEVKQ